LTQKPLLQLVFDPKHLSNHDKPIHGLKNQTQPETKNQHELRYVFLQTLKVQKHLIYMNSLHQMEQFDTKTPLESGDPSLSPLSLNQG